MRNMRETRRFRHKVIIQQATETAGDTGGVETTWSTWRNAWVMIEPLTGKEAIEGDRLEAVSTIRIRMRYCEGLTTKHRILFDTRVFEINSAINVLERNEEYELLCSEWTSK